MIVKCVEKRRKKNKKGRKEKDGKRKEENGEVREKEKGERRVCGGGGRQCKSCAFCMASEYGRMRCSEDIMCKVTIQ